LNYSQEALNTIVARSALHFTDPQQVVRANLSLPSQPAVPGNHYSIRDLVYSLTHKATTMFPLFSVTGMDLY